MDHVFFFFFFGIMMLAHFVCACFHLMCVVDHVTFCNIKIKRKGGRKTLHKLTPHLQCFFILLRTHISTHYTLYPVMMKWKQVFRFICKYKYLIYISIQTLCCETRNWAQVHPVSIDHPWDVSTTWMESTCVKFNWLDIIWKGTHLSI